MINYGIKSFIRLTPGNKISCPRHEHWPEKNQLFYVQRKNTFRIDVTFEMRTVHHRNAFIQMINSTQDSISFISKQKRGQEDKKSERQRESKGERVSVGYGVSRKLDR